MQRANIQKLNGGTIKKQKKKQQHYNSLTLKDSRPSLHELDEPHGGLLLREQAKGPFSINSSGLMPSNVIEEEADYDGFVDRGAK